MALLRQLAFAALVGVLADGCNFAAWRTLDNPGVSQVVRVTSGERYFFDLDENMTTGYSWDAVSDDSDVEVRIDHNGPEVRSGEPIRCGAGGKASVTIRIHRGYDGPSTVRFVYRRPWEKKPPVKEFTISLFKRTGDVAFWK